MIGSSRRTQRGATALDAKADDAVVDLSGLGRPSTGSWVDGKSREVGAGDRQTKRISGRQRCAQGAHIEPGRLMTVFDPAISLGQIKCAPIGRDPRQNCADVETRLVGAHKEGQFDLACKRDRSGERPGRIDQHIRAVIECGPLLHAARFSIVAAERRYGAPGIVNDYVGARLRWQFFTQPA